MIENKMLLAKVGCSTRMRVEPSPPSSWPRMTLSLPRARESRSCVCGDLASGGEVRRGCHDPWDGVRGTIRGVRDAHGQRACVSEV